MVTPPRVAVIGAGCSGITTVKNLLQAGVSEVVCYEQNDRVGGNWIYSPTESHSSVCETTHIISSKKLSEYMDFPMPEDYPDYPSHEQVLAYFQHYAEHFGLLPYIRFNTSVEQAVKIEGERWELTLGDGSVEVFDYLFVANGHHHSPRHPEGVEAAFTGKYLHAHQYKTNRPFAGERVLVIGAGNSGCDCAVEISRVAKHVAISIRNPQYIVPKFFLGRPTDTFNEKMRWLPDWLANGLRRLSLRVQVGNYRDYGLPNPDFPVTKAHPTLNSELLYKIRHGKVHPRRGIASIDGQRVRFTDGKEESYDTIVAATGYRITLPFFDPDFISYEEAERVPLYLRMFHPDHPTLVFIGLFQPQGAIWPLSDYQAKLAANLVMGRWSLPDRLAELAEQDSDVIAREFLPSKRHTIEVHYHPFLRELQQHIPANAPGWPWTRTTIGQEKAQTH
ncbi:MAG: NAD(P)-binding domain-containing protein [Lewinella sp.]|nr:NAD(P)-binding domain-containing protein [Lewinella sp.]